MKTWVKIVIAIGIVLLILQIPLFTPAKNYTEVEQKNDITTVFTSLNDDDMDIYMKLYSSCYACHSNKTENYPWYYHTQPVSWWMNKHIQKGKKHLNFSEFATYSTKKKAHKLHEIAKELKEHEMPLSSYLWMHDEAKLTDNQRKSIVNWANKLHDSLVQLLPQQTEK